MSQLKELIKKNGKVIKIKKDGEESFTLASGRKSRFFVDIKEAICDPNILQRVVDDIKYYHHELWYDCRGLGGLAVGGIPVPSILSYQTHIPLVIIRTGDHDRGTKTRIIGEVNFKKILLFDDVAASGRSVMEAVLAIRESGGRCKDVIVIVDREEDARSYCSTYGIKLHSLLKKSDFGVLDEL